MVSRAHSAEIRLSRLAERCRASVVKRTAAGEESVETGGFSAESFLRVEDADAAAMQFAADILPEWESMKIDKENAEKRAAERRVAERKAAAGGKR